MRTGPTLRTTRLVLRRWQDSDRKPYAQLNADPLVHRYLAGPASRADSDAQIDYMESEFERRGYGLWAVEVTDRGEFIGFTGLSVPSFTAAFTPAVEVGWRLASHAWGYGYATEAARAALQHGFETHELSEIVSFTTVANERSRAVMRRLDMTRDPADDFDHPRLPPGHPLGPHVLYRLSAARWRQSADLARSRPDPHPAP